MSKWTKALVSGSLMTALIALPGAAAAAPGTDRDRDRLPDRWERQHRLPTNANSARRDPDRDNLNNRAEYRLGMDPRDRDSDDDGVRDSQENAGVVQSFTDGVLVIEMASGDTVRGAVNDDTRIRVRSATEAAREDRRCERGEGDADPENEADAAHRGGPGGADGPAGPRGPRPDAGEQQDADERAEALAKLVAGAVVHEARLRVTSEGTAFGYIELVE